MNTYEKIKKLCESKGFAISSLGKKVPQLSISRASITGWKNGSKPRPENLRLIAAYFGVPVEYFSDGEQEQAEIQDEKTLTPQEEAILSLFDQLDVIEQAQLIAFAVELKTRANEKP